MDNHFCVEALEDAIERHGIPEVFNTDQGSQFTSQEFIDRLKREDIQISMDGKGRWLYNVFIERLWRSVKYEEVYLKAYQHCRCEAFTGVLFWVLQRATPASGLG